MLNIPLPPLLGIAAQSGVGKTSLLAGVIPLLKAEGLRVAVVKHTHHDFELDQPGKDSHRLRQAGAEPVILAGDSRLSTPDVAVSEEDDPLRIALTQLALDAPDLILVEGFRDHPDIAARLEVHRAAAGKALRYPNDPSIIAIAADREPDGAPIPVLELNDPAAVAGFILEWRSAQWSFQDDGPLLDLDAARDHILELVRPVTRAESLPLCEALGRVLADDARSPIDVPTADNSAMDGFAFRFDDLNPDGGGVLQEVGTAVAGHPFTGTTPAGGCVRIMTGAAMPADCDSVVPVENTRRDGMTIHIQPGPRRGGHVRRAGEDIAQGAAALHQGERIGPAGLGVLASMGLARISVLRRVRVALFSTGDELRSAGQPIEPGLIYDSNRYALMGLLQQLGAEVGDLGILPDDEETLRLALRGASENADVIITSGGVSIGDMDLVKTVLKELGQLDFWKLAIKPGKPLAFGRLGDALLFGLPGNPVAAMVTFLQLARPALMRMAGVPNWRAPRYRMRCLSDIAKKPGRAEFIRGYYQRDAIGNLTVSKTGPQGSGLLTSMARADCLITLPRASAGVRAGDWVEVEPLGAT
ncbi:bifunctional molybdopterin-guanine dinucleotide biosynthesis adaptor protein MobB/molybdopterin molybdotransferase MoeA [Magnetofaba australis]|nr:bifunctional molybdopterin-guanine dinucleotide biosynthesis adaptor protein MobB/molybdopterin molybdotransferase MoeA [Magnetofaba australis]